MALVSRKLLKRSILLGIASIGLYACGQPNDGGGATGGKTGGSGAAGSGGTGAGGGTIGSGGTGSGGTTASGGATGSGGTTAAGGTTGLAGATGTGGATAAGGTTADGGATGRGGAIGTGGGNDEGGRDAGGDGNPGTGGGAASGGSTGTGGSVSTGSCPTGPKPTDGTKNLMVGSLSRKYILHVPSAYTGTSPATLVLDFHPIGSSASAWRAQSPYPAVIDKEGVISAFPDGLTGPSGQAWNVIGCCVSKVNGADVDDVAFAKAVVEDIKKVACIDPKRIYAVGFSMGGGMSNWLACKAADVFAATGPASFDLTQQNEADCKPSRPLTVIEWRGKNDPLVTYAGGHSTFVSGMALDFLGAVGTFQKWASLDGCTGNPSAADSSGCQTYSQCSASVQVTLCTDNNGGHEAANAGVVWPMLKKFAMP